MADTALTEFSPANHDDDGMAKSRNYSEMIFVLIALSAGSVHLSLAGEAGSHCRCDPGEGLHFIDGYEPLTPTLSRRKSWLARLAQNLMRNRGRPRLRGRGSALSSRFQFNLLHSLRSANHR
jgi:hypothetical protein